MREERTCTSFFGLVLEAAEPANRACFKASTFSTHAISKALTKTHVIDAFETKRPEKVVEQLLL